jgi:hypothetical protein
MLKIDGFDGALVGIASVWKDGGERVDTLIYDGDALMTILLHGSGMSAEEALEYISFNIEGAYVGETTPIIVWPCNMEKVNELAEEIQKDE